jgi:cation/acetate symporter
MTLAFVAIYVVSKIDASARAKTDRAGFPAQFVRSQTGVGAVGASSH